MAGHIIFNHTDAPLKLSLGKQSEGQCSIRQPLHATTTWNGRQWLGPSSERNAKGQIISCPAYKAPRCLHLFRNTLMPTFAHHLIIYKLGHTFDPSNHPLPPWIMTACSMHNYNGLNLSPPKKDMLQAIVTDLSILWNNINTGYKSANPPKRPVLCVMSVGWD